MRELQAATSPPLSLLCSGLTKPSPLNLSRTLPCSLPPLPRPQHGWAGRCEELCGAPPPRCSGSLWLHRLLLLLLRPFCRPAGAPRSRPLPAPRPLRHAVPLRGAGCPARRRRGGAEAGVPAAGAPLAPGYGRRPQARPGPARPQAPCQAAPVPASTSPAVWGVRWGEKGQREGRGGSGEASEVPPEPGGGTGEGGHRTCGALRSARVPSALVVGAAARLCVKLDKLLHR